MIDLLRKPAVAAFLFVTFVCVILAVSGIASRPLFPVDETRYITVAWEMFSQQDWLLPTLNFEPYHHKPPLLFWIVMSLWSLFGVSQQAAMVAPYLISLAGAGTLIWLTRLLRPDNMRLPLLVAALYTGSLPFVVYSSLLMFDILLGVFVLLGLASIWQFAKTGAWKYIALFAAAVGLGVVAKGPVILLHLLFPVILARLWIPSDQRAMGWGKWSSAFFAGTLLGAVIALSWAIPAAIRGGPEFTEKIFWGQTAGRVSHSFDHQRPAWWYLPFLPLFFIPWIFHPGVWRGMKQIGTAVPRPVLSFLTCWLLPALLCFSLISGKQMHYLLPLLPGFILLIAMALDQVRDTVRPRHAAGVIITCALLSLLPAILALLSSHLQENLEELVHLHATFSRISVPVSLAAGAIILVMGLASRRCGLQGQAMLVALAMSIFICCLHFEARRSFYMNYDLAPIGAIVRQLPDDIPLAFVRNYHGEWGFLGRLDRPVKQIDLDGLKPWFAENPHGVAFIRTRKKEEYRGYDILFSMPYKMTNTYAVLAAPGKGKDFYYIQPAIFP